MNEQTQADLVEAALAGEDRYRITTNGTFYYVEERVIGFFSRRMKWKRVTKSRLFWRYQNMAYVTGPGKRGAFSKIEDARDLRDRMKRYRTLKVPPVRVVE